MLEKSPDRCRNVIYACCYRRVRHKNHRIDGDCGIAVILETVFALLGRLPVHLSCLCQCACHQWLRSVLINGWQCCAVGKVTVGLVWQWPPMA